MPTGTRQIDWTLENQKSFLEASIFYGCLKLDDAGAAGIAAFIGCPVQCLKTFMMKRKDAFKKKNAAFLAGAGASAVSGTVPMIPSMARKRVAPVASSKAAKSLKITKKSKKASREDSDDEDMEEAEETGLVTPPDTLIKRESLRRTSKVNYDVLNSGLKEEEEQREIASDDDIQGDDGTYDSYSL